MSQKLNQSAIREALAKVNHNIECLSSQRDNLLAKLNPIENVKPLQWVINDGKAYYQFIEKKYDRVLLYRKGTKHLVTLDNFNNNFTLADRKQVAQHLDFLESRGGEVLTELPNEAETSMNHEFYMITVRGLKGATVRHDNYEKAEKEAIRLSKIENHEAYIMGVVAKVKPVVTHEVIKSNV